MAIETDYFVQRNRRTCFYCKTIQYETVCICCGAPETERREKMVEIKTAAFAPSFAFEHFDMSGSFATLKGAYDDAAKHGLKVMP